MTYLYLGLLFLLGVLGASNLIIAKKPEAKEIIAKLAPIQGWLGIVGAILGVWWLIQTLINITLYSIFALLISLVTIGTLIGLGLLLGIGIMKTFVKNEAASTKLDAMVAKLSPYQGMLGLVAIALSLYGLIRSII